jgi:choice-of-anchor A domain-containing protein
MKNNHVLIGLFLTLISPLTYSSNCQTSDLTNLVVYSKHNIEGDSSDYQGSIAAGNNVFLTHFYIDQTSCQSISAKNNVAFVSGNTKSSVTGLNDVKLISFSTKGNIESNGQITIKESGVNNLISPKRPTIINAGYKSFKRATIESDVQFERLNFQLDSWSNNLKNMAKNTNTKLINNSLYILPTLSENIIELNANDLTNIVIKGNRDQKLIINIQGTSISLYGINISLLGGISAQNIVWNFYEAESLFISNTANGNIGIPGTVLAPKANAEFYEGLITGALYVNNLSFNENLHRNSGQINDGRFNTQTSNHPNE